MAGAVARKTERRMMTASAMIFRTENGTLYEIDQQAMTWRRVMSAENSGPTRRESGRLLDWYVELGEPALIFDDDIQPGCTHHCVCTSRVIEVMDEQS